MDSLNWNHIREHLKHWCAYFGPRRIIAVSASLVCAGVVVWWLVHPSGPTLESVAPRASGASEALPTTSLAPLTVKVHVAGGVKNPGVYQLSSLGRIVDAVNAAGGPVSGADLESINLAQTLVDTEQIFVPLRSQTKQRVTVAPRLRPRTSTTVVANNSSNGTQSSESTSQPKTGGSININTASATELDVLPGVGPSTAQAIVSYRNKKGPFARVEDLLNVPGIGPAKLSQMRGQISL